MLECIDMVEQEAIIVLGHLMELSQHYSHPYIEKYISKWKRDFKIGFLPKGIFPFEQYDPVLLEQMGIYYPKSHYSPFEERIIFPIYDGEDLIAIAGRYPSKEVPKGVSKFINTIFRKDEHFYSKPFASYTDCDAVCLAEGYTDVMAFEEVKHSFQWNCVLPLGIMGLSLSLKRINRLNQMGLPVIIVLDGDDAGQTALFSMRERIQLINPPVYVICLKYNLDPEEYMEYLGFIPFPDEYGRWVMQYMLSQELEWDEIVRTSVLYGWEKKLVEIVG